MELEKTVKTKTLAFKATDKMHSEVVDFCSDRGWNMSKFLERAVVESMEKIMRREKR